MTLVVQALLFSALLAKWPAFAIDQAEIDRVADENPFGEEMQKAYCPKEGTGLSWYHDLGGPFLEADDYTPLIGTIDNPWWADNVAKLTDKLFRKINGTWQASRPLGQATEDLLREVVHKDPAATAIAVNAIANTQKYGKARELMKDQMRLQVRNCQLALVDDVNTSLSSHTKWILDCVQASRASNIPRAELRDGDALKELEEVLQAVQSIVKTNSNQFNADTSNRNIFGYQEVTDTIYRSLEDRLNTIEQDEKDRKGTERGFQRSFAKCRQEALATSAPLIYAAKIRHMECDTKFEHQLVVDYVFDDMGQDGNEKRILSQHSRIRKSQIGLHHAFSLAASGKARAYAATTPEFMGDLVKTNVQGDESQIFEKWWQFNKEKKLSFSKSHSKRTDQSYSAEACFGTWVCLGASYESSNALEKSSSATVDVQLTFRHTAVDINNDGWFPTYLFDEENFRDSWGFAEKAKGSWGEGYAVAIPKKLVICRKFSLTIRSTSQEVMDAMQSSSVSGGVRVPVIGLKFDASRKDVEQNHESSGKGGYLHMEMDAPFLCGYVLRELSAFPAIDGIEGRNTTNVTEAIQNLLKEMEVEPTCARDGSGDTCPSGSAWNQKVKEAFSSLLRR